jgi:tetratricopeptide (TPR) repeat protein
LARPLRFNVILALVAVSTVLAAFGGWRFARASAPVSGPIILVSIDSLRADHLPAYGYKEVATPAFDALAADGIVFERAYSHVPLTLPAHVSLLSGRLPFEHGVRDNAGFTVGADAGLVAERLRDRGYETGAVVSSFALRRATGIDQGFTFFDDELPPPSVVGGVSVSRDGMASLEVAQRWLGSIGTPRAFLFLHLFEPHRPYAPPARFNQYAPYDGEVAYADEIVGRLVQYLKSHQLYDQSTIILVADHGEGLGDAVEQTHGATLGESVLRVPLIVKPSAGEGAGRRTAALVQHVDLVPTILDLAKAPLSGDLPGRSLTPLFDGEARWEPRMMYSETLYPELRFGWSRIESLSDGRHRYSRTGSAADETLEWIGDQAPEQDAEAVLPVFRRALETLAAEGAEVAAAPVSADDQQQFHALGYVGSVAVPAPVTGQPNLELLNRWRLAEERVRDRDWPAAVELLQGVVAEAPENLAALTRLGTIWAVAGREEMALGVWKKVAALDAGGPVAAYLEARRLQERGRHREALAAYELAIAAEGAPGAAPIPDLRANAAESMTRAYRYEEAEHLFRQELERFPNNIRARAALAGFYYALQRRDEASAVVADLVRLNPTPQGYEAAARLWSAWGQPREAAAARAGARRPEP